MDKRIEELNEKGQKIKEKLEKDIIKRKTFEKLLPLLRKIDFENIAYTYKDTECICLSNNIISKELLSVCDVRPIIDNLEYTTNFYIIYEKGVTSPHDKYRLDKDDFMICITDNIEDIELILRGIIGTRICGTKNF